MGDRAAVVYDSLAPYTTGGGELVYRRLAELLAERSIETDYVTRTLWDGEAPAGPFRAVGVWKGEIYDGTGIRRSRAALAFACAVFRYFIRRRGEYRIVIASALPVLTVLAARMALLGTSTRVVADWLEVWPAAKWRAYSGLLAGTLAAVLQWVAAFAVKEHTVNSAFTAARLRAIRPSRHPLVLGLVDLIHPGTPGPAAEPPLVLFVGRLIADKQPTLVPDVVAIARASVPSIRAAVVGVGPERDALVARIAELGLQKEVVVLGRVTDEELATLRSGAAVLLAPSVREGFGLAVAEAGAWGVPVVVVDHLDNAAVDLVDPDVNGYVVADDPASMAAAVVTVIEAGSRLRNSAAEWFARARVSRGVGSSVDALLSSAAGRPPA